MIGIINKVSKIGVTNTRIINELKLYSKLNDSAFELIKLSNKARDKPTHKTNKYTLNIYSTRD